jgi:hypothetical protein
VQVISDFAFQQCGILKRVTLNEGLKTIEAYAFSYNPSLQDINIPNTVTFIGEGAFAGINIKDVEISNSVNSLGHSAFASCNNLISVIMNCPIDILRMGTFGECPNLKSVILPEGLRIMEGCVFKNDLNLTSISIPSSVESIYGQAFEGCSALKEITVNWDTPPSTFHYFDDFYFTWNDIFSLSDLSAITMKVPAGKGDIYRSMNWGFNIVEQGDNTAVTDISSDTFILYAQALNIIIENSTEAVQVYNLSGQQVVSRGRTSSALKQEIPVPAAGVYIVKVGSEVRKVIVQ